MIQANSTYIYVGDPIVESLTAGSIRGENIDDKTVAVTVTPHSLKPPAKIEISSEECRALAEFFNMQAERIERHENEVTRERFRE